MTRRGVIYRIRHVKVDGASATLAVRNLFTSLGIGRQ